jgi:hypothetical protein
MPLPKWPDPVRDAKNNSSSSINSHNDSSSASLNFQASGDLRSPKKRIGSKPTPAVNNEDCSRMFFSEKAEITILQGEDHLAAGVYGDAKLHPSSSTRKQTVTKEHTSGYDFDDMLKGQDITHSWGGNSSTRW